MSLSKKEKSSLLKRLAEDRNLEFKPKYTSQCGTYEGPAIVVDISDAIFATMAFARLKIRLKWDDLGSSHKIIYF